MKELKRIYQKYDLYFWLVGGAYLFWKLRGLFSLLGSVGDAVGGAAAGATAGVVDAAKKRQQKVSVKTVAPHATDADLQVFENDANSLAAALGHLAGSYSNWLYPDRVSALQVAKRYSRLIVRNGLAQKLPNGALATRKSSLQLPVLVPFYKAATDGRSLLADLTGAMGLRNDDVSKYYNTFVK